MNSSREKGTFQNKVTLLKIFVDFSTFPQPSFLVSGTSGGGSVSYESGFVNLHDDRLIVEKKERKS